MAVATSTAILTAALLGGGAAIGSSMISSKAASKMGSSPMPLPQAPGIEASQAKASDVIKKKRATASQSIYTSPLGVAGEANIVRKTLLGQ